MNYFNIEIDYKLSLCNLYAFTQSLVAQSAGAVEYTDYTSAEG